MSVNTTGCFGTAPRWETYGVPCPSVDGFDYEVDAGLIRTPFDSGHNRQRRRYTHRPTTYSLNWRVNQSQLFALEQLVMEKGYDWLYVPMVTGQVPVWMATDHLIRFASNLQVSLEQQFKKPDGTYDGIWAASITAEQYEIDIDCMTDQLCTVLRSCLPFVAFPPIVVPQYLPVFKIEPRPAVAIWGTWSKP